MSDDQGGAVHTEGAVMQEKDICKLMGIPPNILTELEQFFYKKRQTNPETNVVYDVVGTELKPGETGQYWQISCYEYDPPILEILFIQKRKTEESEKIEIRELGLLIYRDSEQQLRVYNIMFTDPTLWGGIKRSETYVDRNDDISRIVAYMLGASLRLNDKFQDRGPGPDPF